MNGLAGLSPDVCERFVELVDSESIVRIQYRLYAEMMWKSIDDHVCAVDLLKYLTLTTICIHFMHTKHSIFDY